MIYYQSGSEKSVLSSADLKNGLYIALEKLGVRKNVIDSATGYDKITFQSRRTYNLYISVLQGMSERYTSCPWDTQSYDRSAD